MEPEEEGFRLEQMMNSSPDTDGNIFRLPRVVGKVATGDVQVTKQAWDVHFYPFQRLLCSGAVLRLRTQGNTRPLGLLWPRSHLHPRTPRPHKPLYPYHIYRPHTGPGTISGCWSRLCRPLCRNLDGKRTAAGISEGCCSSTDTVCV